VLFFVPLNADLELWHVKVTNTGKTARNLRAFTYVEFASNWNAIDDMNNLQYTQYIIKTSYVPNIIDHGSNVNIPPQPHNFQDKDQGRIHSLGSWVTSIGFDTTRDEFIGPTVPMPIH
jgi:cellobiose phosphorylase